MLPIPLRNHFPLYSLAHRRVPPTEVINARNRLNCRYVGDEKSIELTKERGCFITGNHFARSSPLIESRSVTGTRATTYGECLSKPSRQFSLALCLSWLASNKSAIARGRERSYALGDSI